MVRIAEQLGATLSVQLEQVTAKGSGSDLLRIKEREETDEGHIDL